MDAYGPALPPHLQKSQIEPTNKEPPKPIIGPALPPGFEPEPTDETNEEENEEIGPLPPGATRSSRIQSELEERALEIKLNKYNENTSDAQVREEWMLSLPEVRKPNSIQVQARQFSKKSTYDSLADRSVWTDTPNEKEKKKAEKGISLEEEARLKQISEKNAEEEKRWKEHKGKRKSKSLLEDHMEKQKKKKKNDPPAERKPFKRETDLKVNHFDEKRKSAILKGAQLLDDRFSSGQAKFL